MVRILCLVLFFSFPARLFATAQVGDVLLYKGDTLQLFTNPLEDYFEEKGERSIGSEVLSGTSTACWRGYLATWKVEAGRLFLISVQEGCISKNPRYYPILEEFGEGPIIADWFSGRLLVPIGEMLMYEHMGYASIYSEELIITIDQGNVIDAIRWENPSYESPFTEDIDSAVAFLYHQIDWEKIPDLGEKSYKLIGAVVGGDSHRLDSAFLGKPTDIAAINEEMLKALHRFPEWTTYYQWGKPIQITWYIILYFSEEIRSAYYHPE